MDDKVTSILEFAKIKEALANQTTSELGRRLAEELQPCSEYNTIIHWLDGTDDAQRILLKAAEIPLGGIRNIEASIKRATVQGVLETHEFLAIASTLYAVRGLKRFFSGLGEPAEILGQEAGRLVTLQDLEQEIERAIDEHGEIRDSASVELQRIRREMRTMQQRVKERLESIIRSSEYQRYMQDALVTIRSDRYVVPIKQEYRHLFPGIVHDQSASGATVFMEPMAIVNINNDIKQLASAEHREMLRILQQLTVRVA